jgi:hypothetical protein
MLIMYVEFLSQCPGYVFVWVIQTYVQTIVVHVYILSANM